MMRYALAMRRFAFLVLVAGCGAHGATGPAWPKSAGTERVGEAKDDGGESLAPRQPAAVAAIESSGDDDAPAAAPAPTEIKPAVSAAVGGVAPTDAKPADPDTPVMLDFEEEIIITPEGP
jgi:hypothetical protein